MYFTQAAKQDIMSLTLPAARQLSSTFLVARAEVKRKNESCVHALKFYVILFHKRIADKCVSLTVHELKQNEVKICSATRLVYF